MTKSEVAKFMSKIRGCYPNQFFLEDDVINEWTNRLEPYDKEDVERKFEEHLKGEMKEKPPMVHYLTNYIKTHEEKYKYDGEYKVSCNLCGKWMTMSQYDSHYDRCLSIEYLLDQAKQKGENIKRRDIENCREDVLNKLYEKYKPQEVTFKPRKI